MDLTNIIVVSKKFGEGVISQVEDSINPTTKKPAQKITVRFSNEEKQFYLWTPFASKTLTCKDPCIQKQVEEAIELSKKAENEIEESRKKEAEAQKIKEAEEKARIQQETSARMKIFTPSLEQKYSRQKLQAALNSGLTFSYLPFAGHKKTRVPSITCFSNWYPCEFEVEGVTYHTTEQFMMAQKALLFNDHEVFKEIMASDEPRKYKALGRKVKNFDGGVWNDYKYSIVLEGCKAKFSQNKGFGDFLLSTGDTVIIEAAKWDNIWGIKMGPDDPRVNDPFQWQGTNLLGFILMEVRDYLKEQNP